MKVPYKSYTAFIIFLVLVTSLPSCDGEITVKQEPREEPKTFYGKTIKKTRDLNVDAEKRNKELEQQNAELFGEQ